MHVSPHLVMFKEGFQGLKDLDFGGDARLRGCLSLDDSHPKRPLVSRDEALQVLEEKPCVVPFSFQLGNLLVLFQHVLARLVQLFCQGRKFLENKKSCHQLLSKEYYYFRLNIYEKNKKNV